MDQRLTDLLSDLRERFAPDAKPADVAAYLSAQGFDRRQIGEILDQLERQAVDTAVASEEGLAAVEVGTLLQGDVVDSLRRIAAMVDRTTAAAREITEATRQQRFASDAVVTAMATVTLSGERYRSGSRGHAEAARRLNELAEGLKGSLSRFKVS